jgi:transcription antitermination protein NusB
MLNRRHIRIKVLQAFYAYFQSNNQEMAKGEKEMLHSMQRIYDLYLYLLQLFISLKRHSCIQIEESKRSTYLKQDPLVLNTTFADNSLIDLMEESATFKKLCENRKISWEGDVENDLVKKLFKQLYKTDLFKSILISKADDFESQKDHLLNIFKEEICNFSLLHHFFDERSIYWQDDLDHVASMVIKTIKSISSNRGFVPMDLWKDDEEDFARNLFRKAILQKENNDKILENYSKNWESDRLARMDTFLMNLAMTEAKEFSSIPVKVTLNEYIEISKFYSTPKSNGFINGLLDKIFDDFKKEGLMVKTGRGLIS